MSDIQRAAKPQPAPSPPSRTPSKGKNSKKKKGKGGLVVLIVLILIIGAGAALLYFNIYSLRDMLFGALRDVPFIGVYIPQSVSAEPGRFDSYTTEQLIAQIERLERQADTLNNDKNNQQTTINDQKKEIERLLEFEEAQAQYKQDLEEFHKMVYEEAPLDFWQWYTQMNPDLAAELAREAAGIAENAAEVKQYINRIRSMDEKTAAEAMNILMDTRSNLVRDIMRNLDPTVAGAILDKMEPEKRAALLNLLTPTDFMQ